MKSNGSKVFFTTKSYFIRFYLLLLHRQQHAKNFLKFFLWRVKFEFRYSEVRLPFSKDFSLLYCLLIIIDLEFIKWSHSRSFSICFPVSCLTCTVTSYPFIITFALGRFLQPPFDQHYAWFLATQILMKYALGNNYPLL